MRIHPRRCRQQALMWLIACGLCSAGLSGCQEKDGNAPAEATTADGADKRSRRSDPLEQVIVRLVRTGAAVAGFDEEQIGSAGLMVTLKPR